MPKDEGLEVEGIVIEKKRGAMFRVQLNVQGNPIIDAHISGKLRQNFIRIIPGDKVTIIMSPYDMTQGRIVWRDK